MKNFLLASSLVFLSGCAADAQDFKTKSILNHIKTLSDDKLEGRGSGTAGEKAAAEYIISQFKKAGLKPLGDNGGWLQAFPFRHGAHGEGATDTAANVIGYLDNGAAHTIVIGAHYDHLGVDGQNSSLDANPANKIHNGADDNASGVTGVLELARYYAKNKRRENYNFLFICFSAEELGLIGSKYFTENPTLALDQVNFMINMDMIGRLDTASRTLLVHGTGTSPVWEPLLQEFSNERLVIKTDSSGVGPSDHTSFYLKDIPVLHFFTGAHADYHKPTDDWDKINLEGQKQVLELIAGVIDRLDTQPKLAFLKTRTRDQGTRTAFKVTLGVMPSYSSNEKGLKVDGVTEGRPGHKAGIQTGDVIIQMGEHAINDIQEYMEALGKFEKGQTVPIKVKRGDEVVDLTVTF